MAKNVYEVFYKDKELFESSNYSKDTKYYNNANNLVVGKTKDETCGVSIKCFVGLKSKTYTVITEDIHGFKIAKCINKTVVDDDLK